MIILGCAPPPGTYNPKSPGPKVLKGIKFNKAERFKEPTPQVNKINSYIFIQLQLFNKFLGI